MNSPTTRTSRRSRIAAVAAFAAVATAVAAGLGATLSVQNGSPRPQTAQKVPWSDDEDEELEARQPRPAFEFTPGVQATFLRDGYRPGSLGGLVLWRPAGHFTLRFFRVSKVGTPKWRYTNMQGIPVSKVRSFRSMPAHTRFPLEIGDWPSGVYFARLRARKLTGFAPFVVGPRWLGEHHVLVVEPTFTWQAYNYRDDNGDGIGDTWYADPSDGTVRLDRPFMSRGVPPHFGTYDLPFIHWLEKTGKQVDFMSDSQYAAVRSARALRHAYELIIFPGHHEYVTTHEYDLTEGYRNLGGNLMFLSANNFYWKIIRVGNRITRMEHWRDLGRPEAALVGTQFIRNDDGRHQGQWVVRNCERYPWIFGDSRLKVGAKFGHGGIEIDHTSPASPPNTAVIASMRNLMGPGVTAQMTFYVAASGAKVFAAGAFTMGGARDSVSLHLMQHLWDKLAPSEAAP